MLKRAVVAKGPKVVRESRAVESTKVAQPRDQLGFHICLDSGQEAPSENMRHSADPTSLPVWRLMGAFICLTCHVRSNWCHNLNEEHEGVMAKSISNFFCFRCLNERIGSRLEHALSL